MVNCFPSILSAEGLVRVKNSLVDIRWSSLLSKIVLPLVFCVVLKNMISVSMWEEHKLYVFENRMP